jgi:hypothetical protein
MRANAVTIGFLVLAVSAISACTSPASAQLRSGAPLPSIIRVPFRGAGTTITVTRSCNRPLDRRGRNISAFIQSYDSVSGILTVSTTGSAAIAFPRVAYPYPEPVFQTPTCLPMESQDGRRQTLSALVPEKFVVIWVSDIVMPTQPPQFILIGIEVYDSVPTHR